MAENGTRLKAAETVAHQLGEVVDKSITALESMPSWRPANKERWRVIGGLESGRTMYQAWREAFQA